MSVFSDRVFPHRPRPDPAPEDLRIPDRARAGSDPSVLFPEPRGVLDQRLSLGPVRRDAGRPARRHLVGPLADPLVRADVVVDAKAFEQRRIVFPQAEQKVVHRPVEPLHLVDVQVGMHIRS